MRLAIVTTADDVVTMAIEWKKVLINLGPWRNLESAGEVQRGKIGT